MIIAYIFILIIISICDILYGSVTLSLNNIFSHDFFTLKIIELRLTQMLQAILAGSGLSLCGATLQRILKNPLADPFILGISSGGTCFTAIFVLLNMSSIFLVNNVNKYFPLQSIFSIIGCLLSLICMNYAIHKIKSNLREYSYLIAGIILNSFFSAFLMIVVSFADEAQLSQIHSWLIGSLQPISLIQVSFLFLACAACVIYILKKSHLLNHLLFEDDFTRSLGVNPDKIRNKLIIVICIFVSFIVSISGSIGFIGLIIPHYVRRMHAVSVINELYLCMLFGSIVLVTADLLSKITLPPSQLPIGIFTALIGAPALCSILLRKQN